MRARTLAVFLTVGLLLAAPATGQSYEPDLNLYDWMGLAPIVIHARVQGEEQKYLAVRAERVIRGEVDTTQPLLVDVRRVNRSLDATESYLKFEAGTWLVLLLEPAPPRKKKILLPTYDIVRGKRGIRELPLEGSAALLDAAAVLAEIQDAKNESLTWKRMRELLEETNPYLILTSLDHHMKFRRGNLALLPVLRPLLDHPRADLRQASSELIGEILARRGESEVPERDEFYAALAALARRDDTVSVRVAATHALRGLWDDGTEELLRRIARDDPEQMVRYTAQRLLLEERGDSVERRDGS